MNQRKERKLVLKCEKLSGFIFQSKLVVCDVLIDGLWKIKITLKIPVFNQKLKISVIAKWNESE